MADPDAPGAWMSDVSNSGKAAVEAWVDRAVHELTTQDFAQIDLDDLLGDVPARAVEAAMNCLQWAVTEARKTDPDMDGMVTVPLPWSVSLTQDSPSVEQLVAQPWKYGPGLEVPALYLFNPGQWRRYEPAEEYRRDLGTDGLAEGWAAYYRTWKAASSSDEYNRAVFIRTGG